MNSSSRSMQAGSSPKKTRTEQMLKRSAPMQLSEQSSNQQGRSTVVLRRSGSGTSENSLTLDNKNPSKLVVKPDGNILWEMPTEESHHMPHIGEFVRGAAEAALALSVCGSAGMGFMVGLGEIIRSFDNEYTLTSQHLAKTIAVTISSTFAGTIAGLTYAPLLAARMVCGRFARPAAVVGACWAATRGVMRLLALRGLGPASLLAQLEEAALNIGGSCILAAEKVAERAAASGRFRRAFVKLGGVDMLLKLLKNGLDGDAVRAIVRALAELLREPDAQQALVNGGGVALLVHGLSHPDADVTTCCTEMLARLTSKGVSQIDVSVGYQQIRESGGIPVLVQLLSKSTSASKQLQLLSITSSLAAGSAEASSSLADAGMGRVLLQIIGGTPLPRTQVKEAAISTLHALTSSDPTHLASLLALPHAQQQLESVAAAYGNSWYCSKAALTNLLGRFAAAEADEEAAAAAAAAAVPIAGDAPEMVDLP